MTISQTVLHLLKIHERKRNEVFSRVLILLGILINHYILSVLKKYKWHQQRYLFKMWINDWWWTFASVLQTAGSSSSNQRQAIMSWMKRFELFRHASLHSRRRFHKVPRAAVVARNLRVNFQWKPGFEFQEFLCCPLLAFIWRSRSNLTRACS